MEVRLAWAGTSWIMLRFVGVIIDIKGDQDFLYTRESNLKLKMGVGLLSPGYLLGSSLGWCSCTIEHEARITETEQGRVII